MSFLASLLFALVFVGYPVAGLFSAATDLPHLYVSLSYRGIVALLALFLITENRKNLFHSIGRWTTVLYFWWGFYAIRLILNCIEGHYPETEYEFLIFFGSIVLPILALSTLFTKTSEKTASLHVVFFSAVIVILATAGEYVGLFGQNSMSYTGRLSINTVNAITLGQVAGYLIVTLAINVDHFFRNKIFAAPLLLFIALTCMSLTESRGPFISTIITLGVFVTAQGRFQPKNYKKIGAAVVIIGLLTGLFCFPLPKKQLIKTSFQQTSVALTPKASIPTDASIISDTPSKTIGEIPNNISSPPPPNMISQKNGLELKAIEQESDARHEFNDESTRERATIIHGYVQQFKKHPLFGISNWSEEQNGIYPHNLILEAFTNLGLFGGLVFLGLCIVGLCCAWVQLIEGQNLIALLFVQSFINGMCSGALYADAQFWLTLALLLSTIKNLLLSQFRLFFARNLPTS